jgi:putative ABC transport system permease protein
LRRLVERGGHEVPLPPDGVLVTKALGEILGLGVGDRLDLEVREGKRATVRPLVAGFVDESVGLMVYARADVVAALEHDNGVVSQVLLKVERDAQASVEERLRRSPRTIDISDVPGDVQRLRDMNGSIMDVWTLVSISLGACVVFGVVYNNARIALAMRSRELASLRVLGFSRAEISAILIGGLVIEVAIGIPVGLVLGRLWSELFMRSVDQETFRWAVVVAPRTYALATAVAVLAAAASALVVRRGLDRLDLIGVLKTRE